MPDFADAAQGMADLGTGGSAAADTLAARLRATLGTPVPAGHQGAALATIAQRALDGDARAARFLAERLERPETWSSGLREAMEWLLGGAA